MTGFLRMCALAVVLLAAPSLLAQEPDAGSADAGVAVEADAGEPEPPQLDPFLPPASSPPERDGVPRDGAYEDEAQPGQDAPPDTEPFAQGDMEAGAGLGGYGDGSYFALSVGGLFAYYVVARLAPGLDLQYTTVFSEDDNYDYPDSLTLLPFLKFVIMRSTRFAPYVVATGGREFEWGGDFKTDAWIAGGGVGAHIGIAEHFAIKVQLLLLYYWYDDTKVYGYRDKDLGKDEMGKYIEGTCDGQPCRIYVHDEKDLSAELVFPVITVGMAFTF
jgi:hypothetical protein